MAAHVKPGTSWVDVYARCVAAAPEAFEPDRVRNLWDGRWHAVGRPVLATAALDGSSITGPSLLEAAEAAPIVTAAVTQHEYWGQVPLEERKARVSAALDALSEHRDLLALLLVWEIGKPWKLACADVDRCIEGVRWYVDEIERMLVGRRPLPGPVSNIASWNYPMSVLMHSMLVQVLAGNAVIGKAPTDGGVCTLTLACALAVREGLPVTLVSGPGSVLSPVLVDDSAIGCVAFVGGRDVGGRIARRVSRTGKRHLLEQEGLNCWGVWEFSQWDLLSQHMLKGFEYAKQRCTAYPRYVVQRSLFAEFLDHYLRVLREVRFGHPLAVEHDDDPLPDLHFGPLINAAKAKELREQVDEAVWRGGIPLYRGSLADGTFLEGQDTSAYLAPVSILEPARSSALFHAEPFGPVDTIVVVDSEAELLAAMNVSNGSLVASLACDDEELARRLAEDVRAFKVGINKPRSRGDKAETFGGMGASWRGAFVGGELLVRAVTEGSVGERLYGNFPDYTRLPVT
nr:putative aldehyde dehydrogenase [uncultured bacterium]